MEDEIRLNILLDRAVYTYQNFIGLGNYIL